MTKLTKHQKEIFRNARHPIGDWESDLVIPFVESLKLLSIKIRKAQIIERADETADEIDHAIGLYNSYANTDNIEVGKYTPFMKREAERKERLNKFFDYVRDNIQNWWD